MWKKISEWADDWQIGTILFALLIYVVVVVFLTLFTSFAYVKKYDSWGQRYIHALPWTAIGVGGIVLLYLIFKSIRIIYNKIVYVGPTKKYQKEITNEQYMFTTKSPPIPESSNTNEKLR